jgi:hypothetical protein
VLLQVSQCFDLNVMYHSRYFYVVNVVTVMVIDQHIGVHNKLN